ncbi:MAG: cell wall hydrolase [Candidatus Accumulibacter similis]|nr:MAG: cell wall hydrolase [Candidatus Accumulibacter similis]
MGLVAPVLDWYSVKPFTRDDPATLDARPRAGNSPRLPQPPAGSLLRTPPAALSDEEIQIVAKTLWGEARGEGKFGMEAVASVIVNRLRRKYRRCDTAAEVCLDPQQFSCWNSGDPNRAKMKALNNNSIDAEYRLALQVAAQALGGGLPDPTHGALHYVARTLRSRPNWLLGKTPCLVMGNHEFYNDVA